jgi:hypothetical protein
MMSINGFLIREHEILEKNMNIYVLSVIIIFIVWMIGNVMVVIQVIVPIMNFVMMEDNNIVFLV